MNDNRPSPDAPKLTAYALGELSGDDRAAVEATLRQYPELRATVEDIRAAVARIESALAVESAASFAGSDKRGPGFALTGKSRGPAVPPAHPRRRGAPPTEGEAEERDANVYPFSQSGAKLHRFPAFYYVLAGVAAAAVAMMVAWRDRPIVPSTRSSERVVIREIALAPTGESTTGSLEVERPLSGSADARVAGAGSTDSSARESGGASTSSPETPSRVTRFVESDLSLIGQTRRDFERQAEQFVSAVSDRAGANPESLPDRRPEVPTEKITVRLPPAPSPEGALAVVGSTEAGITASVTASPGTSEIVTLSAFVVSADRGNGFGATTAARDPGRRRRVAERDALPVAPPGARFGRNPEVHAFVRDNEFVATAGHPRSTFAIDVDTASYANVRRIIEQGTPPAREAVRIEELLNYFPFRYGAPQGETPVAVSLEVAAAPWAPTHQLVRIGLKARDVTTAQRPAANLVFLLDVSASMNEPNKLPLVKQSLRLLLGKLRPDDRVAIVTYAGSSGLALPSTLVAQSREILNSLDALAPAGSTNGAMGIELAYDVAKANFIRNGINRVILCTDGDFNVGQSSEAELLRLIEEKAGSGVYLTVLGFGLGNYQDVTLEKLAHRGNGNYGYIDTRRDAEKLLVEQVSGTLVTVAKDVKVQVVFNPAKVQSYRLIGYENRLLRKEDFNDDTVDSGELGAGHTVTALYEIIPVGTAGPRAAVTRPVAASELLTVNVRFKKPESVISWPKTLQFPLYDSATPFVRASADFRFAAAVAQFGMILRGSPDRGTATMADVGRWATTAVVTPEDDPGGYRTEFIELVRKTQTLLE